MPQGFKGGDGLADVLDPEVDGGVLGSYPFLLWEKRDLRPAAAIDDLSIRLLDAGRKGQLPLVEVARATSLTGNITVTRQSDRFISSFILRIDLRVLILQEHGGARFLIDPR